MRDVETCYLLKWSTTGVTAPRERICKAAAELRKQQLEGLGFRVQVTNIKGEALPLWQPL